MTQAFVANLLLSPTVKELLKSASISQSYVRISSGIFFMDRCVVFPHQALWQYSDRETNSFLRIFPDRELCEKTEVGVSF